MPFFEYRCAECGKVFTLLQKRDSPRSGYDCPDCASVKTERVLSTFATVSAQPAGPPCAPSGGGGGHCCGGSCACGH